MTVLFTTTGMCISCTGTPTFLDEFWQVSFKYINSKPLFRVRNRVHSAKHVLAQLLPKALPTLNGGK